MLKENFIRQFRQFTGGKNKKVIGVIKDELGGKILH